MSAPELLQEQRDEVLLLTLNRPESRNALTPTLIWALTEALEGAESDPGVRAVVLTASGDKAFCAGMDLKGFAAGEAPEPPPGHDLQFTRFQRFLRGEVTVPVIGAAPGAAVGGGFELLLGCDLVVASMGARFGLPEVKRGLFASGGGTAIGARAPLAVALELALTGELIGADRAYELGLVNAVVPGEDLLDRALDLAGRIARNGPLSVRATQELVRLHATHPDLVASRHAHWLEVVFGSEDAKEGAAAFLEKRDPVWRGR